MALLTVISATLLLITLVLAGRTLSCIRRRHFLRAGGSCMSCVVSGVLATVALMLMISYYSYARLTAEQLVARVEFRRLGSFEYQARMMIPGERDRFYNLHGDEWQIDARLVNWKPPATILGLEPIYRLERLSGRYSEIDRERTDVRSVHALSPELPLDVWRAARRFPALMPGIDAYYGSATYVPMADGALFEVSLSRDALIARPANERAEKAIGDWGLQKDPR